MRTAPNLPVREVVRLVCRQIVDPNPPGIIAYHGPPDVLMSQPHGEALSEFILMVGSHKAAIRMVQSKSA